MDTRTQDMAPGGAFAALLAEFAGVLGLPRLVPGDNGVCSLAFDERLVVNLAERSERGELVAFACLGPLPAPGLDCCRALLRANDEGGEVVLALDAGNHQLMAVSRASLETMDLQRFQQWLEGFVLAAESWRDQVAAAPAAQAQPLPLLMPDRA